MNVAAVFNSWHVAVAAVHRSCVVVLFLFCSCRFLALPCDMDFIFCSQHSAAADSEGKFSCILHQWLLSKNMLEHYTANSNWQASTAYLH